MNLHCASCGRIDTENDNSLRTITVRGEKWCTACAAINQIEKGVFYVSTPCPGRVYEGSSSDDPLDAWIDCYAMKPKKRILIKTAREEIQRSWQIWDGDKSSNSSMFTFFVWLKRHRPYFLTFRSKGDPWQRVHSWLIQYEKQNIRENTNND